MLAGFTQGFRKICDLLVFGGVWALTEIPGPNRRKIFGPEKNRKNVDNFVSRCCFKKYVFVGNGADFRYFFRFRPWCPLLGVRLKEKIVGMFSGPKWAKNAEKVDFSGLGGRSGLNTRRPNLIAH